MVSHVTKIPDDPDIPDTEVLFRRLVSDWIVPSDQGRMRISSAAFLGDELSVVLASLLQKQGRTVDSVLEGYPGRSLCSVTAGLVRANGQGVIADTRPPHDPAHGLVIGKKTKSIRSRLARAALWVIPSEAPEISTTRA